MDNVKTRTSAKADKKGLKRRAGEAPLKQQQTRQVCLLLAVPTLRQWKLMMLAGALLAPPPGGLGHQGMLTPPRSKDSLPLKVPLRTWEEGEGITLLRRRRRRGMDILTAEHPNHSFPLRQRPTKESEPDPP